MWYKQVVIGMGGNPVVGGAAPPNYIDIFSGGVFGDLPI